MNSTPRKCFSFRTPTEVIRNLLATNEGLERIVLPMLEAWSALRSRVAELSKQLIASGRASEQCQLLMSIPGIGVVTASSFIAAIEDPANFAKSRSVGDWTGLTTRRYQSGEVDHDSHFSRRGDNHLRGLLFEVAMLILTRVSADSMLRNWGLKLREKIRFKRATVAVVCKLAMIMHAMLKSEERFDRFVEAAT